MKRKSNYKNFVHLFGLYTSCYVAYLNTCTSHQAHGHVNYIIKLHDLLQEKNAYRQLEQNICITIIITFVIKI